MAKRKYTKRSEYWNKFNKERKTYVPIGEGGQIQPDLLGEPFYTSDASFQEIAQARRQSASSSAFSGTRQNRAAFVNLRNRFSSIAIGMLPYEYSTDGVNIRDAIELCQKAYANVAVFRNAIDIMSEFTNTDVYLEGGSRKSRQFFEEWFRRINLINIKDQYFREYYRSGNVFLYRMDGRFRADDYAKIINQVGAINPAANKIPLRYVLLNPYDITAKRSSTFSRNAYEKVLSEYELARLRDPQTDEERALLDSFDEYTQKLIKDGGYTTTGIKMKLDGGKLSYSFYKKQDYEPFAVPFGFPVLDDINAKMELKKMDQAITRTVENVILLITMGADPDKGGVNPNNLAAMQNLFKNESVGRVLVSDYTTKAEFIIPELNRVLGPDKYKILNEDIKQGLQNIVVGEEKYNSTQVKAQIFIDRLKESRNGFLNDFLQREIKRIASDLGFRSYPQVKMKDIDMRDETQLMRVSTRLMELGILTPQQGMEMFHNGKFPDAENIAPAQETFIQERKGGFYNPLVGGVPMIESDTPKTKTPNEVGRPEGTVDIPVSNSTYSRANIQSTLYKIDNFINDSREKLVAKSSKGEISESMGNVLTDLCESIVCSENEESWAEKFDFCVNNLDEIENLETLTEVLSISAKHNLELYPSAILYHSTKES